MKKLLTAFFCLFPSKLAHVFLKLLGHKIAWSAKIGCSLILVNTLELSEGCRIGHLNIIKINSIHFKHKAYIGHLNIVKGPFSLDFDKQGAIGNSNIISRAALGITYGKAVLKLGELAKITARHTIDLTKSIHLEDFTTIAGSGTQVWTHGYIHAKTGPGRVRIDGEVVFKNNVYIGSNCVVNAGVTVHKGITVGSNSTIPKDLIEPGMYVGEKLRHIEKDISDVRSALKKVEQPNLVEEVYEK